MDTLHTKSYTDTSHASYVSLTSLTYCTAFVLDYLLVSTYLLIFSITHMVTYLLTDLLSYLRIYFTYLRCVGHHGAAAKGRRSAASRLRAGIARPRERGPKGGLRAGRAALPVPHVPQAREVRTPVNNFE